MTVNKKVQIIGGGTIEHVAAHLALSAPAYGQTARRLSELAKELCYSLDTILTLTKMAGGDVIETNSDVSRWVANIINDPLTKIVFFNVALVDFGGAVWTLRDTDVATTEFCDPLPHGKYATRLQSNLKDIDGYAIELIPTDKIVDRIRAIRKDITLVAFKTTCGATEDEQYIAGLNLLKRASCNLVLANDVKTHVNMVITPEEARYHVTTDRDEALRGLVEMASLRSHLTFTRSTVLQGNPIPWQSELVPDTLRTVVNYCISEGAYKPFRGATVGHFACRLEGTHDEFLTSRRKTNFNDLDKLGLVRIKTDGPDSVIAYGSKPSVGGMSQRIIFKEHEGYDCIAHFHCPIRPGSKVPIVSQREFECGSHECGNNTSSGLREFRAGDHKILAVYLDQHGPNIVFKRDVDPYAVIKFIEQNFDLKGKTGGFVEIK